MTIPLFTGPTSPSGSALNELVNEVNRIGRKADAAPTGSGTVEGTNTGDQDLSGLVPKTTEVNGHGLDGDIDLTAEDVGAQAEAANLTAIAGLDLGEQAGKSVVVNENEDGFELAAAGGATSIDGLSDAFANTTNVLLGETAYALTSGTNNTVLGIDAGAALTAGFDNTLIGSGAGKSLQDQSGNTAIGKDALCAEIGGGYNTAIGTRAAAAVTNMFHMTAIGYEAAKAATTGGNNVIIGAETAMLLTTAANNVIIGKSAGEAITTQGGNVIVGANAASRLASTGNVVVGQAALDYCTTGADNVAIGQWSGGSITTGSRNIMIGASADVSVGAAKDRITIGSNSGVNNLDKSWLIGDAAGFRQLLIEGPSCGVVTLVAGTATVDSTLITENTRIVLSTQALGTVIAPKAIAVTARSAGTSFTITSADATDTSIIFWEIKEPRGY